MKVSIILSGTPKDVEQALAELRSNITYDKLTVSMIVRVTKK